MKEIVQKINNSLVGGLTIALLATLTLLIWKFEHDTPISLINVCIIAIGCYLVCICTYAVCSVAKTQSTSYKLPDVKNISIHSNSIIFVTECLEIFSIQSVASVYRQYPDDIEVLIGLAYVETKNEKGFLQIRLMSRLQSEHVDFLTSCKDNTKKLSLIKIKPSIPKDFLRGDLYHE